MPKFDYTYKAWDKLRPALLPSTGLGEVLKKYEKEKAKLIDSPLVYRFLDTMTTLNAVEKIRAEAITACGKMFKDTKKELEAADHQGELDALTTAIKDYLVAGLKDASTEIKNLSELIQGKNTFAEGLLKVYKAGKATEELHKKAMKFVHDEGDSAVPGISDLSPAVDGIREKKAVLKRYLPEVVDAYETIVGDKLTKVQSLRKDLLENLKELTPLVDEFDQKNAKKK